MGQDSHQFIVSSLKAEPVIHVQLVIMILDLFLHLRLFELFVNLPRVLRNHLPLRLQLLLVLLKFIRVLLVPFLDPLLLVDTALVQALLQFVGAERIDVEDFREGNILGLEIKK